MGFQPTTPRDLVGCSNHLSYWRLYGEQGPICGSPLEPHHAATQPTNDWHTRTHYLHRAVTLKHIQDAANQPPKWVFCILLYSAKKKLCVLLVLKYSKRRVHPSPLKKNPGSAPEAVGCLLSPAKLVSTSMVKAYWLDATTFAWSDNGLGQMIDSLCKYVFAAASSTCLSSCLVFSKTPRNL